MKPYAAGFFDGEGSISLQHQEGHGFTAQVYIAQMIIDPLKVIQDTWGGTLSASKQQCWYLRLRYPEQEAFLQDVLPYLLVKKQQAELLLEYHKLRLPAGKRYSTEAHARRSEIAIAIRDAKRPWRGGERATVSQ